MTLRERYEARVGKTDDRTFQHIFELALDDQKQYVALTAEQINALLDPGRFPPSTQESEHLDEIRERLLEAMEIIADIVTRRNLTRPAPRQHGIQ